MKQIKLPIFSLYCQKGEIASLLTVVVVAIMVVGIIVGNKINKEGTRALPRAAGNLNPGK